MLTLNSIGIMKINHYIEAHYTTYCIVQIDMNEFRLNKRFGCTVQWDASVELV